MTLHVIRACRCTAATGAATASKEDQNFEERERFCHTRKRYNYEKKKREKSAQKDQSRTLKKRERFCHTRNDTIMKRKREKKRADKLQTIYSAPNQQNRRHTPYNATRRRRQQRMVISERSITTTILVRSILIRTVWHSQRVDAPRLSFEVW